MDGEDDRGCTSQDLGLDLTQVGGGLAAPIGIFEMQVPQGTYLSLHLVRFNNSTLSS